MSKKDQVDRARALVEKLKQYRAQCALTRKQLLREPSDGTASAYHRGGFDAFGRADELEEALRN